ncbi:MAG: iron uptake porin, partial [Synechococcus sp.]
MNTIQPWLLAPVALGLLAPMAASAKELNLDGVNRYASQEQVTSISQFSDVRPTDWAYQALSNLIERYGCVAGYPNGTYKGGQAMTRFEAAALLNACLDRITEVTDELRRLMKEFEQELAVLKGRVDGLEAKVGELEASQFSTTTKLSGLATFVLGANAFGGTASRLVDRSRGAFGATTFNYDVQLNFDTSFTGKDLLRTTLRAGNFDGDSNSFGGAGPSSL